MVWNITHDPAYATALEQEWVRRMKTLKFRTEHLAGLSRGSEENVISEFAKAAPYWADQRKSLDRVESFLFDLQRSGKFIAHAGCMQVWGEEVHKKPASFHSFFKVENLPRIIDRKNEAIKSNPAFRSDSSFEALNAYLAIDPQGCLEEPDLLSKNWVLGLSEDRNRDAATVAIFSAFYRYGDQRDRHLPEGQYSQGRIAYVSSMIHRISESSGKAFGEILRSFGSVPKAASPVNRFYSELVAYREGTSGANLPTLITNLHSIMVAGGLFELAMQAKVFSTPAHSKVMEKGCRRDADESYYNWVIDSEFSTLSEIKAILEPDKINAEHLAGMHEIGFAVPYLKSLDEDTLMAVIGRGVVLPKYLSRASDRGRLLETDLGM